MHPHQQFKTINYRGSLVEFELPADWTEEHDPDSGGTFYPPEDDSVTLRLNVLTLQPPQDLSGAGPERAFEVGKFQGLPLEKLSNGQVLCVDRVQRFEEDGQALELHPWLVARSAPLRVIRLATFAVTVVADRPQRTDPILAMLMAQVRNCRISDAPAAMPSKRAWWQRLIKPRGE